MIGIEFLPQDVSTDTHTLLSMLQGAREHLKEKVGFVIIPSNPRNKSSVHSLLGAYMLRERLKNRVEIVPTISGAGLSELGGRERFISELMGVKYAGFASVAIIGGDSQTISGVCGIALAREILGDGVRIISGSSVKVEQEEVLKRLEAKLRAGANHIITQPLFSKERAEAFMREFHHIRAMCGSGAVASLNIFGIFEAKVAGKINKAHLGFEVEEAYIKAAFGGLDSDMLGCVSLEEGLLESKCLEAGTLESHFSESSMMKAEILKANIAKTSIDSEMFPKACALRAFIELREALMQVAQKFSAETFLSSAKHNDKRIVWGLSESGG